METKNNKIVTFDCSGLSSGQIYNISKKFIELLDEQIRNISHDISDYWGNVDDDNKAKQDMIGWCKSLEKQRYEVVLRFKEITNLVDEELKNK